MRSAIPPVRLVHIPHTGLEVLPMTRLVAVLLPVSIFGLGAGSPPAAAQTAGKGPTMEVAAEVPPLEALVLMRLLQQPIDTKGLQEKVKLKTALEYFSDKFGGKLPMIVDREAFGPFVGPEDLDPYEEEVVLPPVPSKMLMSTALRLILSQVGKGQATYVIRQSYIEITTLKAGTAPGLLYRPLIVAAFEKRPLKEVLQELANAGGLEIHLDPNIGKKADAPHGFATARRRAPWSWSPRWRN